MEQLALNLHPKRWILSGFLLTIPTVIFWGAVIYSAFTHNHTYVDGLLYYGGVAGHALLIAVLPITSFLVALLCRAALRRQAIARNMWHRDTPEMKVNQGLINWNMMLIAVMVISLINN